MSEPGGLDAGPLYVDVVADLTGFSRGLQQKINAEVSRIKASITAEIDTRKAEAQLAALARKDYVASIKAEAQVAAAQADLDRTTAKQRVAQIKAEAQTTAAKGELDSAAKDRIAQVTLQAQTTAAEAKLTEATAKQRVAEITAEAHVVAAKGELDDTAKDRIAKIEAEAQVATAQADLDRAAAAQRIAQIKAEAQTAGATGELDAATKDRIAKIEADAQTAVAEAKLTEATAKDRIAKIEADADVARAQAELDQAARDRTVKIKVDTSEIDKAGSSLSGFGSGAVGLLQMPAIAAGISMAVQAVVQLAGGLASVAAAAAPVVGLLGAIPGLVAGAAQGIGSVLVGFMGISTALKANTAAQAQSGAQATATAAQHQAAAARIVAAQDQVKRSQSALANAEANAAYAVKQAQQGVVTAHQEAARAIQQAQAGVASAVQQSARNIQQAQQGLVTAHQEAARSIASAEQTVVNAHQQAAAAIATAETQLATSQRAATQAQLDLNKAREEATRQLQDMNDQVAGGRLSVEQDQINVQRAAVERTKVFANPTSTLLDREQADLSYRQSVQSLQDQQIQQQRLEADTTKANKAGVEGSDLVVTAKQRLMDANQKVIDSEKALQDARTQGAQRIVQAEKALQDARLQGAQKVKQAEATLQDARVQGAQRINQAEVALQDARVQGAQKVAAAEAQLTNTRRTSAYSVQQAQQQVVSAQQSLTAAQAAGTGQVQKQTAANAALAKAMGALSPAGRDFVTFLQKTLIPAWQAVQKATQEALLPPVQRGLTALMPLLGILRTGMVQTASVIGGAFERLATTYLATPLFKRDLASIMASNNRAFQTLGTALVPLARALVDITVASQPLLRRFTDFIATSAILVGNFIHAQRETGNLGRFFKLAGDTAGELWRIVRDLAVAIFNIGKEAYPAGKSLLDSFAGVVSKFRDWTTSLSGKNQLRDYFDQSKSTLAAVGRLVRDIIIDLFQIGRGGSMAGLIDEIRTRVLPPVKTLIQTLNSGFGPALINAISDVATLIGDLGKGSGGGALTTFVNTLDSMVKVVDRLTKSAFGRWLLTTAANAAAMGLAFSIVLGPLVRLLGFGVSIAKFGEGFVKVAKGGAEAAKGLEGIAKTGASIASKVVPAIGGIGTAIRGIGTAATIAGRAFLASGPWGWIILGITAAVAAFIYAFTHFKGFHDFVMTGLHDIGQAALWFWHSAIVPAFNGVVAAIRFIGGVFTWLYSNVVHPVFSAIAAYITWWWTQAHLTFNLFVAIIQQIIAPVLRWFWNSIIRPIFTAIGNQIVSWWNGAKRIFNDVVSFIRGVFSAAFTWFRDHVITPVFNFISKVISDETNGWKRIFTAIINFLRNTFGPAFTWFRDHVINPVFTDIKNIISNIWQHGISPVFEAIKTGLGKLQSAFKTGVSAIGSFWNGLKAAVTNPVKFVVETIFNKGIIGFWNAVATKVGAPTMQPLKVQGINAARGVVVPGYAPGVDVVNAVLSPGEGVLVPEAVRGLAQALGTSAERAIQTLNSSFSSRVNPPLGAAGGAAHGVPLGPHARRTAAGLPRYDLGGVFGWVGDEIKQGASAVGNVLGDVGGALKNALQGLLSGPLHAAAGPVHALINRVLPTKPPFANMIRTGANTLIDNAVDWLVGQDQAQALSASGPGGGVGWKELWAIIHKAFPKAQLFSAYRPNAITVSGNTSYHALGEAIDVTPSMTIFDWIAKHYPKSAELIFSPAGIRQIKNGLHYMYTGAVRAEHFNHVHWALGNRSSGPGGGAPLSLGSMVSGGNAANQRLGQQMAAAMGWTGAQWTALRALWNGESGWNNLARNPSSGAFGIPQALPPGKMGAAAAAGNAAAQIRWGLNYIKSVYGSPANALSRWLSRSPHWYALGGLVGSSIQKPLDNVIQWLTPRDLQFGNVPAAAADPGDATGAVNPHQAHQAHLAHLAHLAQTATKHVLGIPAAPSASQRHLAHLAHLAHLSHVGRHALGGLVSNGAEKLTRLFDSGGILNPGVSLVENATGKPEVVFTSPQWDTLSRLAGAGASALYHEPTASERGGGAQVDIHVYPTPGMDTHELARKVAVEMAWQMRGA